MRRKGLGKGKGKGYKNITGKDPKVHSQSAKGIKQPQKIGTLQKIKNVIFPKPVPPKPLNVSDKKLVDEIEPIVKKWGWRREYNDETGNFWGFTDMVSGYSYPKSIVRRAVKDLQKAGAKHEAQRFF